MPIAPEPMTSSDFGMTVGTIACRYDQISLPSASMPGSSRARAPVARMMCGAFNVATGLASFSTANVCLPASLAVPSNTAILFLRIRCATPEDNCFATARDRLTILSISNVGVTGAKP